MSSMLALNPGVFARDGPGTPDKSKDLKDLPFLAYDRKPPANNGSHTPIPSNQESPSSAQLETEVHPIRSSASYVVTRVGNLESDLDHWMQGNSDDNCDGLQFRGRYFLEMLPLNYDPPVWCGPTASVMMMISYVALVATYIKNAISCVSRYIAHLSLEQILRNYSAAGLDIMLALQTFVFLVLSVYLSGIQIY